jgi:RNA polymerase sigma factor (sigma-70 family)
MLLTLLQMPPPAPAPLPILLRRTLAGNRRAKEELFKELVPEIRARISWLIFIDRRLSPSLREDYTQDVVVALLQNNMELLRRYQPSRASLQAYVCAIAKNFMRATAKLKRETFFSERNLSPEIFEQIMDDAARVEESVSAREEVLAILESLRSRTGHRDVTLFIMHHLEGLSSAHVAEICGMSPGNVDQICCRTRKVLESIRKKRGLH